MFVMFYICLISGFFGIASILYTILAKMNHKKANKMMKKFGF